MHPVVNRSPWAYRQPPNHSPGESTPMTTTLTPNTDLTSDDLHKDLNEGLNEGLPPQHIRDGLSTTVRTLFAEAHAAGLSTAGILATISDSVDTAYLCHHLEQHSDPTTPDPLPISKDLRTKTGLPTRRGTDLHRACNAALASPALAGLLHSAQVTPDQLAIVESIRINNLIDELDSEEQARTLDSFYTRCATELEELNTSAQRNNAPISPVHLSKIITAICDHPDFNNIRKDKDSTRTIWSAAGGKGCTLSLSGPKSLINQIADKAQAVAPAFLGVLDDTGQAFLDHLNTDGIDGMPGSGSSENNTPDNNAPDNNADAPSKTKTPAKYSPKVWTQLTGITLVKALLIGLEHMNGALHVAVRHRTREVVTRAMGQAGEFRVILDTATGSLLRGAELERLLGFPLVTKDLSGAWVVASAAAARLADLGTNISLTFVNSQRPESVPQYQPPAGLRQWVIDHCGGCMYPGCDRTTGLELDHLIPYHYAYSQTHCQTGPENLHSLCTEHHRLRTKGTVHCWTDDGGQSTSWCLDDGTTAIVPAHGILATGSTSTTLPPTMTPEDVKSHVAAVAAEYLNTHPNTHPNDHPKDHPTDHAGVTNAPPLSHTWQTVTPDTLPLDMFAMPGEENPGMAAADDTPPF